MSSPPVSDPYLALGLTKDSTSAQVKSTYRKLVLKHHPDKVKDDSQKEAAADRFNSIQQAYEILIDDDRRQKYDASVRLAELRRDVLQRSQSYSPHVDPRPPAFDTPSATPRATPSFSSPFSSPFTYPSNASEGYTIFGDDTHYNPSPKASRRPSYTEREPSRTTTRNETERRSHAKRDEKAGHSSRRRSKSRDRARDKDKDRASKYASRIPDDNDSDSNLKMRKRSPKKDKPTTPFSRKSSDSDVDSDPIAQKYHAASVYLGRSISESDKRSSRRTRPVDELRRVDDDSLRRASASSLRDTSRDQSREKPRDKHERPRKNSDAADPQFPPERPMADRTQSTPAYKLPEVSKSRRSDRRDPPILSRSATGPADLSGSRSRRDAKHKHEVPPAPMPQATRSRQSPSPERDAPMARPMTTRSKTFYAVDTEANRVSAEPEFRSPAPETRRRPELPRKSKSDWPERGFAEFLSEEPEPMPIRANLSRQASEPIYYDQMPASNGGAYDQYDAYDRHSARRSSSDKTADTESRFLKERIRELEARLEEATLKNQHSPDPRPPAPEPARRSSRKSGGSSSGHGGKTAYPPALRRGNSYAPSLSAVSARS